MITKQKGKGVWLKNESIVIDKNYDSHAFSKPQWKQSSCPHKCNVLIFFFFLCMCCSHPIVKKKFATPDILGDVISKYTGK